MAREQATQVDTDKEFFLVWVPQGYMSSGDSYGNSCVTKQTAQEARDLAAEQTRKYGCKVFVAKVVEWAEVPVAHCTFGGAQLEEK